ncbi:MAG: class II fumarate hydratase [Tissierellia bacterium]|nr:class II fumarate hydratase [Tissierellia bacterium]
MNYRIERDSMGEVRVEESKLWKAQTQRSLNNFHIGKETLPLELIYAIVELKKSIALVNADREKIDKEKAQAISKACDLILKGSYDDQFPLSVWQTGSGTQTNMNVNEVISSIAEKEFSVKLHPNDHVNKSQSTNDVFPSAIHIASYKKIKTELLPSLNKLKKSFDVFISRLDDTVKVGRTHLQDATPIMVKQEVGAWAFSIEKVIGQIETNLEEILNLAIGGTAVGTGLNTFEGYSEQVVDKLNQISGFQFKASKNKFYSLASKNEILMVHSSLNALAAELIKIGNDIRWLASGPRAGIGEYVIPSNEPGSSIMPGKVNPTQIEALTMVCAQVFGNQESISFAASQGNFQLNVYMPLIAYNVLQSIELLTDITNSFREKLLDGIKIDKEIIRTNLEKSLMTVTALNPYIGYDKSAELAKYAYEHGLSLYQANDVLGLVDKDKIRDYLDPKKMV